MATYPTRGTSPWDQQLQSYIDDADAATDTALAAHESDTGNPHQVTAAQVGAPTTADLTAHTADTTNPHGVTAAQAAAIPAPATAGTEGQHLQIVGGAAQWQDGWILSGSGQPSGVPPRGVGSVYVDQAETAGAVRWVYTSPGWVVEYGDTGLRDISGELVNGWSIAGHALFSLTPTSVRLDVWLDGAASTDAQFWTVPASVRHSVWLSGAGVVGTGPTERQSYPQWRITTGGNAEMSQQDNVRFWAEWPRPAWLTTLPGVPA